MLGVLVGFAVTGEADGFRCGGRSVRRVVEHMGYRARLTGRMSGSGGSRRFRFGRIARDMRSFVARRTAGA